jgi:multidrug resistance protein, MATE family
MPPESSKNPFTSYTPGGIREMIAVALPMFVSFGCDTVMIFTDRLLLSRLGPVMMNASLGGGISFYMMITFMFGLLGYITALAAQYLGAGQKQNCAKVTAQGMILILIAWPIIFWAKNYASELFRIMGVSEEQIIPQTAYFHILVIGAPTALLRHCLASFFSGIGRTRVVMVASLLAMAINVGAGYTLIFGKFGFPQMGIEGAAWGAVFASFCACLILGGVYFSKKIREEYHVRESFRFRPDLMKKLLRYGYPSGVEMFLAVMSFNFMVMTFHSLGPVAATASSIVLNWDMVTFVPLMGIEIGVTSLVGRYMGAGRPDTAHKSVMSGVKVGSVYSLCMLILFLFFTKQLVTVFHPDQGMEVFDQALPAAVFMLRLVSLYLVSMIIMVVFVGALRGAGDTLWAMGFNVILHWIMAGTLFAMLRLFHFPIETGWSVMVALFLVLSTMVIFRYREGKWKTLRIVEPAL